jgi:hypothetical protein
MGKRNGTPYDQLIEAALNRVGGTLGPGRKAITVKHRGKDVKLPPLEHVEQYVDPEPFFNEGRPHQDPAETLRKVLSNVEVTRDGKRTDLNMTPMTPREFGNYMELLREHDKDAQLAASIERLAEAVENADQEVIEQLAGAFVDRFFAPARTETSTVDG